MEGLKPKKNREYKRLTIERVKQEKGCEQFTDEEAMEVVDALEQLSIIMFNLFKKEYNENNQPP